MIKASVIKTFIIKKKKLKINGNARVKYCSVARKNNNGNKLRKKTNISELIMMKHVLCYCPVFISSRSQYFKDDDGLTRHFLQKVWYKYSKWLSPWSSRLCVGLLGEKPGFESQARHQNKIRKVFLRRFPLSRFLAKTLRVNKIAMKSFSKNLSFGVDFKL